MAPETQVDQTEIETYRSRRWHQRPVHEGSSRVLHHVREGAVTSANATTAEFVKLMENTYRDVNIALANQVADIAATHNIDPAETIRIANQHPESAI